MDENRRSDIVKAWENFSEHYQKTTHISTHDVHYGPLAYGENRLNLMGDVNGKKTLEIGCGGGQNTIALARWGAQSFGVDPTGAQIEYARSLAEKCSVNATFEVAPAETLPFQDKYFDIAFSSFAFDYVADMEKAFAEAYRVLKKGGIFIFCGSHPYFIAVGFYLAEDPEEPEIRDYLSWPEVTTWTWGSKETPIQMWSYNRTLSQIVNALLEKGFTLQRMVEQGIEDVANMSEEEKKEIPYLCTWEEKEYPVQRKIPSTLILKVRKL